MEFIYFLLGGFGVTTIITKSKIFEPLREKLDNGYDNLKHNFWGLLINCPLCVGFWVGVFLSLFFYSPADCLEPSVGVMYSMVFNGISKIVDGAMVGVISWVLLQIIDVIDKLYYLIETKELYYQFLIVEKEKEQKETQKK